MSSSRALASAQQRRASGGQSQSVATRPGTSIASHSAFAQQQQQQQQRNPRMARAPQQQMNMPPPQMMEQPSNGLPFSKLTISDAIGLITLRLGKVEQFILDSETNDNTDDVHALRTNIPDNTKLIDNSVLTSIINRLDSLEKKEMNTSGNVNEQMVKLDKDLRETKDLLMSLLVRFETFSKETNVKFGDFDFAISEIERSIQPVSFMNDQLENSEYNNEPENDVEVGTEHIVLSTSETEANSSSILSVDLKNIIKQELTNSNI